MILEKLLLHQRECVLAHMVTMEFMLRQLVHLYEKDDREHWNSCIRLEVFLECKKQFEKSVSKGSYQGKVKLSKAQGYTLYNCYLNFPIDQSQIYQWNVRNHICDELLKQML